MFALVFYFVTHHCSDSYLVLQQVSGIKLSVNIGVSHISRRQAHLDLATSRVLWSVHHLGIFHQIPIRPCR